MASPVSSDQSVDPRVTRSRAAILSAAADELVDRGFASFTMDGVVARSGVAKTTVYRHRRSRGDLLPDVVPPFQRRFIMRRPIPPAETEPFIDAVLTGLAAEPSRGHRRSAPVGRRRS